MIKLYGEQIKDYLGADADLLEECEVGKIVYIEIFEGNGGYEAWLKYVDGHDVRLDDTHEEIKAFLNEIGEEAL